MLFAWSSLLLRSYNVGHRLLDFCRTFSSSFGGELGRALSIGCRAVAVFGCIRLVLRRMVDKFCY